MTRRLMTLAVLCGWATAAAAQSPAPAPSGGTAKETPAQSAPDTWVPKSTAEIIMLDKLRAQPTTLTIKAGQSATYGTLTIAVKSCQVRPADLPQNATAFLDITDSRGSAPVFHGWVLANTPSVSQYEHPVYDLRLAACK
jgi:hypothetical protein